MMRLLQKSETGIFATQTLSGHLIRGAVALTLLYAAIRQQDAHPVWAVLAGLAALVAMRGCPMCWTIGLIETISQRLGYARGAPGGDLKPPPSTPSALPAPTARD